MRFYKVDSLRVVKELFTFLQSFQCFTGRRGLPQRLVSDNAKTFKAAPKDIEGIFRSNDVQLYLAIKGVVWSFIIERAPWHGGFYERLIKSTKCCLKKSMGKDFLSFEEMRTILVEIEATLNNRPHNIYLR